MSYNWIDTKDFTMNSCLLMDRWLIRMITTEYRHCNGYAENLSIVLANKPTIAWYFMHKCPEVEGVVRELIINAPKNLNEEQIRSAEEFVLDVLDTCIVYVHPEIMNKNCNYINNWNPERLYELADFTDKIVLDVGSGTGRLAFAAATKAKRVYASEPVDELREFLRDKIKRENISNVKVLDGMVDNLPYEDNTFDIVMSGHVVGDDYDSEIAELTRVVKNGGYILDCMGEDDRIREKPDDEMLKRGFEYFYYKSSLGGDIFRYRKKVKK